MVGHCTFDGMIRCWARRGFMMNCETGTNSPTYAIVELFKTNPIGRILPIAILFDYLLGPVLE